MKLSKPFLLLALLSASAAADLTEQLEICAALADAEARLACFDAIGRSNPDAAPAPRPETPQAEAQPPQPAPEPVPQPQAPPTAPVPEKQADAPEEFGMDSMTAREREQLEQQRRDEERLAEADRKLAKKEQKRLEKERRRAEKEAKKREREQVVIAKITSVTKHHDERFSVVLDNGQVWRETQGSRVGIPAVGSRVELKRGRFGGYRMNIDGLYQTAWVKRTQ